MTITEKDAARFWSKVDKSDWCWLWTANMHPRGYGKFWLDGRTELAHRFSAEIAGMDPKCLYVCHRCDNPRCVRPEHLFLGDALANAQDAVHKVRYQTGDNHYSRTQPWRLARGEYGGLRKHPESVKRGEKNGNAKLTEAVVREIRQIHASGEIGMHRLANRFGVSKRLVLNIVHRRAWRHV